MLRTLALLPVLLAACDKDLATVKSCERMTCQPPSHPVMVSIYKSRDVCVCAPAEEPQR